MSASVGVFTAAAMFRAIGGETQSELGLEWYSELMMGPCRTQEGYRKHARLIDAEPCVTTLFNPPSSLDKDEDEPPVPEQGEKLLEPEWVPADQPTPHQDRNGHWRKLQL